MGALLVKIALMGKDPARVTAIIGDVRGQGTDNDVFIRFLDEDGQGSAQFRLNNCLKDDFEAGHTDTFIIPEVGKNIGALAAIEIWRGGWLADKIDDDLFINVVTVERVLTAQHFVFPIHRWIPKKKKLRIRLHDSVLPQYCEDPASRKFELIMKRMKYDLTQKIPGLPVGCSALPPEQGYSMEYEKEMSSIKSVVSFSAKLQNVLASAWKTLKSIRDVYSHNLVPLPRSVEEEWYLRDDYFGEQRLSGCNPRQIYLCTAIPSNFAVEAEMVEGLLGGRKLDQALLEKKLFLTDYAVLDGLEQTDPQLKMVAPLVLFYLNDEEKLLPIAIQLQQKPAPNNPVFLPTDDKYTWLMAKTWCNLADTAVHQASALIGYGHLMAETMCLVTHRQLSPSHPLFKLLAPHFRFTMATNNTSIWPMLRPGGWADKATSIGSLGVFDIIRKTDWRMNVEGNLPTDIEDRGVGVDTLPHYPYRDDAMPIYTIIKDYVTSVVEAQYGDGREARETLAGDKELQAWAVELSKPADRGGAGIQGVPGAGRISNTDDLINILTSMIFTCSVQHAATNINLEVLFPTVYPALLRGEPASSKAALTEEDVLAALPSRQQVIDHMTVYVTMTTRFTKNPLGDFSVKHGYDPDAEDALTKFREDLEAAREEFTERNKKREFPYTVLSPAHIPNSIS